MKKKTLFKEYLGYVMSKLSLVWFEVTLFILFLCFLPKGCAHAMAIAKLEYGVSTGIVVGSSHHPIKGVERFATRIGKFVDDSKILCTESKKLTPNDAYSRYVRIAKAKEEDQREIKANDSLIGNMQLATDLLLKASIIDERIRANLLTFKPYFLADAFLTIYPIAPVSKDGQAMDEILTQRFQASSKKNDCYLESYEEAISAGQTLSVKQGTLYLEHAIRLATDSSTRSIYLEHLNKLDALFLNGPVEAFCDEEYSYALKNHLIDVLENTISARNLGFAKAIQKIMQSQSEVVIAIGQSHFCGNNSLLHELRKMGLKVTQFEVQ